MSKRAKNLVLDCKNGGQMEGICGGLVNIEGWPLRRTKSKWFSEHGHNAKDTRSEVSKVGQDQIQQHLWERRPLTPSSLNEDARHRTTQLQDRQREQ